LLATKAPCLLLNERCRWASALGGRLTMLWVMGRPVIFLSGLCLVVGTLFLPLSFIPSLAFFLAGLAALGVALQLLPPPAQPDAE
jgi:hypothetical protein